MLPPVDIVFVITLYCKSEAMMSRCLDHNVHGRQSSYEILSLMYNSEQAEGGFSYLGSLPVQAQ